MEFTVGEVVQFKKEHPCGNDKWEILRVGADVRVRCIGCGRMIMLPRKKFEKSVKQKVDKL
ncbi:hypothetical protein Halha_2611 [Halobacteroides halobius DSM 5150]|uniref:DUF951 domain-containing protein n=1 Tax=Halobacteroides halobius (strain ATCC 35273 / DSM 5150 / MD-1) TaxID=748449 RepID=L0KDN4_HALHC|nr:DUF951 domain-containing protein [Halobacteroides halobius]AGB42484.1 hypothetical protein Halha_2611 [Halobacteroides halobius DSM 5150]